ncbi:L-threonylcarbamoyladenylate synthase [Methanobacterium sp.]|uniref:L-threonylcarbamoyladenylate synthase n=1 Tax=Methanobacterium sp. TaxID=2164 RepID=UPI003C738239
MKIIKIDGTNPDQDKIKIARMAMKDGSIIIYPTDTVYGIGANVFDEKAILKIFSIKKRPLNKPLSICISRIEDIKNVAKMDVKAETIIRNLLPGPFTIILKKNANISSLLTAGSDKIGIRIPDNRVCMDLSREFPITSTSANLSGYDIPESSEGVIKQLGSSIDIMMDAGICKHGIPSTVIDMTVYPPKVLREGAGNICLESMV